MDCNSVVIIVCRNFAKTRLLSHNDVLLGDPKYIYKIKAHLYLVETFQANCSHDEPS